MACFYFRLLFSLISSWKLFHFSLAIYKWNSFGVQFITRSAILQLKPYTFSPSPFLCLIFFIGVFCLLNLFLCYMFLYVIFSGWNWKYLSFDMLFIWYWWLCPDAVNGLLTHFFSFLAQCTKKIIMFIPNFLQLMNASSGNLWVWRLINIWELVAKRSEMTFSTEWELAFHFKNYLKSII